MLPYLMFSFSHSYVSIFHSLVPRHRYSRTCPSPPPPLQLATRPPCLPPRVLPHSRRSPPRLRPRDPPPMPRPLPSPLYLRPCTVNHLRNSRRRMGLQVPCVCVRVCFNNILFLCSLGKKALPSLPKRVSGIYAVCTEPLVHRGTK